MWVHEVNISFQRKMLTADCNQGGFEGTSRLRQESLGTEDG